MISQNLCDIGSHTFWSSFDDATFIKGKLRRNVVPPRQISIGDTIEDFMSLGGFQISADFESENVALKKYERNN